MRYGRAQAIIIRGSEVLFGYGRIGNREGHFFIGGGIEEGESPCEAVLREIEEETNVKGKVVFQLGREYIDKHHTFLVDIGTQECTLGYDPEEVEVEKSNRALQKLVWIPLKKREQFTEIDLEHFKILASDCEKLNFSPNWLKEVKELIEIDRG